MPSIIDMLSKSSNHSHSARLLLVCSFLVLAVLLSGHARADTNKAQHNAVFTESAAAPAHGEPPSIQSNLLLFAARVIDTQTSYQAPAAATTAEGKALHLVQFSGPIQDTWLNAVKETGAEPIHYIANYGYMLWTGPSSRMQLNRLAETSHFLKFSAPYGADLKSDQVLFQNMAQKHGEDPIIVTIQMLRHANDGQSKKILGKLIIKQLSAWEPVLKYQNMRASIDPSSFETIKKMPDVVWIEPFQEPELQDEVQAQILAGNWNDDGDEPSDPGYIDWLLDHGFSQDPAAYPIIDITDDGIGNGDAADAAGDQTLRVAGDPEENSRLVYLINCTQAADASGPDGHGHLNASIAGGYDSRSGTPFQDAKGFQRGMGINPFGRLAGTRVFESERFSLANCDNSLIALPRQSYQAGARILSNSWGIGSTSNYSLSAQIFDTAVRDADQSTPGNQELLILFSAGNDGRPDAEETTGTVTSPANGKNVIAVGASENVRPTWIDGCGFGAAAANDLQDIATYSSRGPAPGNRVKPDLVAPGTHVVGTASTAANYNGNGLCDKYHPEDQQFFAASSGTSFSAPSVSGIASLATFWLREIEGVEDPSPALLKAFLISSASYLTGSGAADDLPSSSQGFGLPSMKRIFNDTPRIILDHDDIPQFNDSGQTWSLEAYSTRSDKPLRIVLTFTDQPGAANTRDPRVNDLDLIVVKNDITYIGNNMEGQWSRPGEQADAANTIEAVFLPPEKAGPIEITVEASNIAGDGVPGNDDETDQDFVLICDNCQLEENVEYGIHLPLLLSS